MDKVARLSSSQRQELFLQTAATMNLHPGLVEKDFWVCWILKHLFSIPEIESHILFKGGTTLSKVFNVIHRFSEDVDLAVDYKMLGFHGERSPLSNLSSKQLNKRLRDMRTSCEQYIATEFLDRLNGRMSEILANSQSPWKLSVDANDKQVVNFEYPVTTNAASYVRPAVRLELGTRADFIPNDRYTIKPYAADYFPSVFDDPSCPVQVIKAERTFWEKTTILHQQYHRTKEHGPPGRYSRHYYDLHMLANNDEIRATALGNPDLLHRVVEHKKRFFRSAWARYDLATPSTLKLEPSPEWATYLRQDYEKMNVMLFEEIPSFDEIISGLLDLEQSIRKMTTL